MNRNNRDPDSTRLPVGMACKFVACCKMDLIAIALLAATAASGVVRDWPQWGRAPSMASFSAVHDKQSPERVRGAEWVFAARDRVVGSPAVLGDRLWFGSDDGKMYCANRTSGRILWAFAVTGADPSCDPLGNECEHGPCKCHKIRSSPAVDPATLSVVFGSYDFAVYKLDVDGKLLWRTETGGAVYGPATLDTRARTGRQRESASPDALIGSFDGSVYRLSGTTGAVRWKYALGAHGDSGWALASTSDAVFGVSNEGGECTSWPPPDCPSPAPSPGGGECYAFGLNATSGEELWKARTGAPGGGGVVVEDAARGLSLFVAGSWAGVVVAYDMHSGKQVWSFRAGGEVESHPAYYGGVVFASAEESRTLFAINATTGKELWRYNGAAQEINSSPSVSHEVLARGGEWRWPYDGG